MQGLNFYDLLILFGAGQGILFSIYLFSRPLVNRKASYFLCFCILGFALNSIYYILESLGLRGGFNVWDFAPLYCSLFVISCFYFFIHFLIFSSDQFNWKKAMWFTPAVFQILFQLCGLFLSKVYKGFLYDNASLIFTIYDLLDIIAVVMGVAVLIFSVKKLKHYQKRLLNNYSEIEDFSLAWLRQLLFLIFGIWLLFAIPAIYDQITDYAVMGIYYPLWIAISALIYWVGYSTVINQHSVSPKLFQEKEPEKTPKLSTRTQAYHQQLIELMQSEQLYLNPELNLKQIAEQMGLSSGYLSQIINQYEGKNFFDFVNGYRVEAFKAKVANPQFSHLNLLGMAFESGFKSKSTFNLAFKKLTGKTPSAYKREVQG